MLEDLLVLLVDRVDTDRKTVIPLHCLFLPAVSRLFSGNSFSSARIVAAAVDTRSASAEYRIL
jgi:hypothetical protein